MAQSVIEPFLFAEAGRLAGAGDNAAIAIRVLPAGSHILIRQLVFEFTHTILEGHRFAVHRIRKGERLLSWGLPFGLALRDIEPGEYLCNERILRVLSERKVSFALPKEANFEDFRLPFQLSESDFKPGAQVVRTGPAPTFQGIKRTGHRGVGTRNYVVILGTSSRSGPFARRVAEQFRSVRDTFPNVDGVVAIEHTEGSSASTPRNLELTLRTLAGFIVHPNVGAVLSIDYPAEKLSTNALRDFLSSQCYPTENLVHESLTIAGGFSKALTAAVRKVQRLLPVVNGCVRETVSISELRVGLQCGGSDAFSGISANPLAGIVAREVVAYGGSANLAETDELIGAESWVLRNVRDLETARQFLSRIQKFQEWAALHGHSAEGNPSGGNMYRGLYNISIKSIGAARKKDSATRLDYVIDFGQRMSDPGFYFMDSPGNDLESIAGQVASGCNLILFATGNGSVTNFPFVPTIKIMTTTARFELVRNEMDLNAGRYLDGEPLEKLGAEALDYTIQAASGKLTAGEKAGHSQVQLWREWRGASSASRTVGNEQKDPACDALIDRETLDKVAKIPVSEQVALVLPTSLCSGEVARMIAASLNKLKNRWFTRAVALPHTEGCGNSGGESETLFMRTMIGYMVHPLVAKTLLLEHGCEKTHNDRFRRMLAEENLPEKRFGFASVQLDGGIERATQKVLQWFEGEGGLCKPKVRLSIGFAGTDLPERIRCAFEILQRSVSGAGGAAVLAENLGAGGVSLKYGERFQGPGFYSMETPTEDLLEIITGLGATGVEMLIVFDNRAPVPGNPLVPTFQIAQGVDANEDIDLVIPEEMPPEKIAGQIWELIYKFRLGKYQPRSRIIQNCAFQITRGYEGISL